MMRCSRTAGLVFVLASLVLLAAGCVERRIIIRSQPAGAVAFLDGERIGVTPITVPFVHYGTREIMLKRYPTEEERKQKKPGYKPLVSLEKISPPWYEWFPIDLISEGVVTRSVRDTATFHAEAEAYYRNERLPPIGLVEGPSKRRLRIGVVIDSITGSATDAATRRFFERHEWFGVPPADVLFFEQQTVPSLDFEGRLMLERPDRIFENPNGHGGVLTALLASGALDAMVDRGIDTLFYYQVDNPLVRIGDPVYVGLHESADAEMSCKVMRRREPSEKIGIVALVVALLIAAGLVYWGLS